MLFLYYHQQLQQSLKAALVLFFFENIENFIDESAIVFKGLFIIEESEICSHNLLYFYGFNVISYKNNLRLRTYFRNNYYSCNCILPQNANGKRLRRKSSDMPQLQGSRRCVKVQRSIKSLCSL